MLILDQRTLQVKYRVPATEIYRMSLSPYLDDVAVFHVRAVSIESYHLHIYIYTICKLTFCHNIRLLSNVYYSYMYILYVVLVIC